MENKSREREVSFSIFIFNSLYDIGRKKGTGLKVTSAAATANPGDGKAPVAKKRVQKLRDGNSFQTYIFRVLKEVKPDLSISKQSMTLLNQILADLFDDMMDESRRLMIFTKKNTLTSREVESAVKILFPGELRKLGVQYGKQSLAKFSENSKN